MKQTFAMLLTLMLILTVSVAVAQLGEPVQDFTVVNENGTLTALSDLLQTKKAVLLHFFAGWLDEDYSDLPAVQAAYAQYGEDIGFIVVSEEEQETVQSLAARAGAERADRFAAEPRRSERIRAVWLGVYPAYRRRQCGWHERL